MHSAQHNMDKTDLNSFPRRKLEETTGTSSYYMDENHSAGSVIQRPQYGRRSWPGTELSTLEIDVYVRHYTLLVVLARNDDDDDSAQFLATFNISALFNLFSSTQVSECITNLLHDKPKL